jgi:hypothetical protein
MLTGMLPATTSLVVALTLQAPPAPQLLQATARPRAADSARVLRDARNAQVSFELTRRSNLPINTSGRSGRCDVRVGRFCYWWDDGEFEMPPEPKKTADARTAMLARLAKAGATLPGDRWIVSQRVRYLVEAERFADAIDVARSCGAEASWCASLAGFAFHAASDFARADSAYAAALSLMPEAQRCKWTDISMLLEGDPLKQYDRLSCANRAAFETRFWALSRPLFLVPANDLRTEHFARLTMVEMIRMSRYPHPMAWGDDARTLMVRYGWETHWSKDLPSGLNATEANIIGHEPTPAFDFIPAAEALERPDSADVADWALHDPFAQSRYAPRYARSMTQLDHQVAFFRRGDSAVVVAAFDARSDTSFTRDSVAAALVLATTSSPDSTRMVSEPLTSRHGVLSSPAPWASLLISVEARDSAARRVARARTVARPPEATGRLTISDILLFDDPTNLPQSLDDAAPRARGSLNLTRSTPVGVYWEMYGVRPTGEELTFTLTVSRIGTSWYRRAAEKLKVLDRRAPVRMKWQEPSARPGATRSRAIAVDFSTLPEGRYKIDLTLEAGGQPAATASRIVDVK